MAKSLQHQILGRALELVSDERSWTRHALARSASDDPCNVADPRAAKFCAIGAIKRAVLEIRGEVDHSLTKSAVRYVSSYVALPFINDLGGREAVIVLFRKALEKR